MTASVLVAPGRFLFFCLIGGELGAACMAFRVRAGEH